MTALWMSQHRVQMCERRYKGNKPSTLEPRYQRGLVPNPGDQLSGRNKLTDEQEMRNRRVRAQVRERERGVAAPGAGLELAVVRLCTLGNKLMVMVMVIFGGGV